MSKYTSFKEIEQDLRKLDLERKIAREELIGIKYEFQEQLTPHYWWLTVFDFLKKYGIIFLIKEFIKRKATKN